MNWSSFASRYGSSYTFGSQAFDPSQSDPRQSSHRTGCKDCSADLWTRNASPEKPKAHKASQVWSISPIIFKSQRNFWKCTKMSMHIWISCMPMEFHSWLAFLDLSRSDTLYILKDVSVRNYTSKWTLFSAIAPMLDTRSLTSTRMINFSHCWPPFSKNCKCKYTLLPL